MALTLLRHTRPDVTPGTCYGLTDLDLAQGFESEAQRVLARLPKVHAIQSSPLKRCRLLAEHIAGQLSLEVTISPHWIEMDFGAWEGTLWDQIPRAELDAWAADFHHYRGHGGESVAQLAARIRHGVAAAPKGTLIVTHAGCIKAALAAKGDPKGWDARPDFGEVIAL